MKELLDYSIEDLQNAIKEKKSQYIEEKDIEKTNILLGFKGEIEKTGYFLVIFYQDDTGFHKSFLHQKDLKLVKRSDSILLDVSFTEKFVISKNEESFNQFYQKDRIETIHGHEKIISISEKTFRSVIHSYRKEWKDVSV